MQDECKMQCNLLLPAPMISGNKLNDEEFIFFSLYVDSLVFCCLYYSFYIHKALHFANLEYKIDKFFLFMQIFLLEKHENVINS